MRAPGLPGRRAPATARDAEAAEREAVAFDLAPQIAAAHGVSPLDLPPDTRARGTGMLALTPDATEHGIHQPTSL